MKQQEQLEKDKANPMVIALITSVILAYCSLILIKIFFHHWVSFG